LEILSSFSFSPPNNFIFTTAVKFTNPGIAISIAWTQALTIPQKIILKLIDIKNYCNKTVSDIHENAFL